MTAKSFTVLKINIFDWVNPASSGLVSVAPYKHTPTIVVSQSIVPIRTSVVQNKISRLTILHLTPFFCIL